MRNRSNRLAGLIACAVLALAPATAGEPPRIYGYEVVAEHPHDPGAFTQGLFFKGGFLFEGTGQHGESSLRKVEIDTGKVVQRRDLPAEVFGEGIAPWKDDIVGLTYRSEIGFVFDGETFETERDFRYAGEGWGLTENGAELIMSDGTAELRFINPETLKETRRITVTYGGKPLAEINELEWVEGEIFANIWRTEIIARIDPETGAVVGLIDMRGLKERLDAETKIDVLNGIAYDRETKRLWVTGKYWPKLFQIRLVEKNAP